MKTYPFSLMKGGWFVGAFEPTAYDTDACEVSYKVHPKGEQWPVHYHRVATEINLLVKGTMVLQGKELTDGTVFILEPYEIADPLFLTDCHIVCVKVPGARDDKVVVFPWEGRDLGFTP